MTPKTGLQRLIAVEIVPIAVILAASAYLAAVVSSQVIDPTELASRSNTGYGLAEQLFMSPAARNLMR